MKTLTKYALITTIIGAATIASNLQAANSSSFSFNKLSESLCVAAKDNSVAKMRSLLSKSKNIIREIYAEVDCQGQSLLAVANSNQAFMITEYLKLRVDLESINEHSTIAQLVSK